MGKEDQVPGWNRQLSTKVFGLLQSTSKSQRTIILERLRIAKTANKQNFPCDRTCCPHREGLLRGLTLGRTVQSVT